MKRALICGISGQDGAYLARFLLEKGYEVTGTSRDAQITEFKNLHKLGIHGGINLVSMAPTDFRSVYQVLDKVNPDEIYNLAGQTSVGLSFDQPVEAMESITIGTLNLVEAIRFSKSPTRLYNAGSSECFGNTNNEAAEEITPFRPRSPYAVAKSAAYWIVSNYRDAYGLFACTGILFNHESPLRPERFVTRKIISTACRIVSGSKETLHLGNTSIQRDWGWAPEYVEAMWKILQQDKAEDFVIATGESHSLMKFVEEVFSFLGLNWRDHVVEDKSLFRPSDIMISRANPKKAKDNLEWEANYKLNDIVKMIVESELK